MKKTLKVVSLEELLYNVYQQEQKEMEEREKKKMPFNCKKKGKKWPKKNRVRKVPMMYVSKKYVLISRFFMCFCGQFNN
jgi:hypothetical protein